MSLGQIYPPFVGDHMALDRAFKRIAEALLATRADFLLGAGMSASRDVPVGRQLSRLLLNEYFPAGGLDRPTPERIEELARSFPLEAIAMAVEDTQGKHREDLTRILSAIFLRPDLEPSEDHEALLAILTWDGRTRVRRLYSTNFDLLIEKLLGDRGATITEENAQEIEHAYEQGQVPVIHLHGTLSHRYEITETDLFDSRFRAVRASFRSALNDADAFVLVGYSLADPDIRSVYASFREEILLRRRSEKKTYVVSPADDQYHYDLGRNVWKNRGAEWIPLDAGSFFRRLRHFLEQQADETEREGVMKKYQLADQAQYEDLVERTADILAVPISDAKQFLLMARTRGGRRQ